MGENKDNQDGGNQDIKVIKMGEIKIIKMGENQDNQNGGK